MLHASPLSLFGPLCASFLVPAKVATAAARRHGQGRPLGRRALRAPLEGGEHGRTLESDRTSHKPSCKASTVLVILGLSAAAALTPLAGSYGATPASQEASVNFLVDEAAARFALPSNWIHAVIAAESGGDAHAISPKGAMGLMQLMPATWRALSAQHGLGSDPFDRRRNVMAGAAYLRQLYDQFGPRGFLAAYNAGPTRYAEARAGVRPLPTETLNYVAKVERSILASGADKAVRVAPAGIDWRAAGLFIITPDHQGKATPGLLFVGAPGRVTP
ncbi:lytic transglycosylase domain-containing protein [Caulobacter sp. FWC2]|uniref:lytic transglycosylase domain-containing protein n=1 Tax=Caulobacter sp. FWC2 TaxID=69664 RepID=UPI000C1555AC|nr:lytic transglycosylase domain-containing protein [Caulobacter sp. FWC2]PIB92599.1 transglycosylase [Caulobacter sp. FWC2]